MQKFGSLTIVAVHDGTVIETSIGKITVTDDISAIREDTIFMTYKNYYDLKNMPIAKFMN